ncbi:MAG: glycosyl hydrolase family 65 protein [Ruminococcus sp.]
MFQSCGKGMQFNLLYRGRKLNIQLTHEKTRVELVSGDAVFLKLNEEGNSSGGRKGKYL